DSEFRPIKFLGATLVLIGIFLIIGKEFSAVSDRKKKGVPWHLYSLGASLFFTIWTLMLKKITLLGFSSKEINLFVFGFSWVGFLLLSLKGLKDIVPTKNLSQFLGLVFLASFFSFLGNLLGVQAIKAAPNPGYHEAIKSVSVLVTSLASIKLFSSDSKPLKISGVAVIVLGVILLVL
ncbi:MAG: hypothetical protein V1841_02180, partial [Patescibacteria group bacterium]